MNLSDLRREYADAPFDEAASAADPIEQFARWFSEAQAAGVVEPNAMTLATADASANPNAGSCCSRLRRRWLPLLHRFSFAQGRRTRCNPRAALVFHWQELERQVRSAAMWPRSRAMRRRRTSIPGPKVRAWEPGHRCRALRWPTGRSSTPGGRPVPQSSGGDPDAAALGWIPGHPTHDRVLAGPTKPVARSASLHPNDGACMESRPPLALICVGAALLAMHPVRHAVTQAGAYDLTEIMRGSETVGREPSGLQWSPDSRWLYFSWLPAGSSWNAPLEPYRVQAANGAEPERVTGHTWTRSRRCSPLVRHARRSSAGGGSARRPLAHHSPAGSVRRLTTTAQVEQVIGWSSDEARLFYRNADNAFALRLDDGHVEQLTDLRAGPAPDTTRRTPPQRAALERDQRDLLQVIRDRAAADSIGRIERAARDSQALRPVYLAREERQRGMWVAPSGSHLLFHRCRRRDDTPHTGTDVRHRVGLIPRRSRHAPRWVTRPGGRGSAARPCYRESPVDPPDRERQQRHGRRQRARLERRGTSVIVSPPLATNTPACSCASTSPTVRSPRSRR